MGLNVSMTFKPPMLPGHGVRILICALILIWSAPSSFGQIAVQAAVVQQPPLDVPVAKQAATDPNAIAVGGWLLYPTLRFYSLYSDNLFFTPLSPLSAGAVGVTPSMVAVWSNGIHTTTLYGNFDRQDYPTVNEVNTLDGRAGITQRYEAMRDLIFTANFNYAHQTWSTGLQSAIQTAPTAPTTTVLPNGNTISPNGTILSPTGQPIGQSIPGAASGAQLFVNPSNQYSGTFSVDKIFNRGILSLSETLNRSQFENEIAQPSFNSRTFSERAAFWVGPLIYVYSNGSLGKTVTDATFGAASFTPSVTATSYQVVGGVGTRQSAIFSGSAYFGHQGSNEGSATAEGNVYGGSLTYRPTPQWTLTGTVDRTINIASQPFAANLALNLPGLTAAQVPIGASTAITIDGLRLTHAITQQWSVNCQIAYSHIEYIDSPRLDNGWVFDTVLRYDVWRNMSLTWEYRYTSLLSNAPSQSATSNTGIVGATYRF